MREKSLKIVTGMIICWILIVGLKGILSDSVKIIVTANNLKDISTEISNLESKRDSWTKPGMKTPTDVIESINKEIEEITLEREARYYNSSDKFIKEFSLASKPVKLFKVIFAFFKFLAIAFAGAIATVCFFHRKRK